MPKHGFKHSEHAKRKMSESKSKLRPAVQRFWDRVRKADGDECWEWVGACKNDGYGRLWVGRRDVRAHRFAWELANGPVPEGQQVLHKCDNIKCVRASHLFLGTWRDNIDDMMAKGRSLKGENHIMARLTETQAKRVLNWNRAKDGITLKQLAEELGVTLTCVEFIRSGRTWKHLRNQKDV